MVSLGTHGLAPKERSDQLLHSLTQGPSNHRLLDQAGEKTMSGISQGLFFCPNVSVQFQTPPHQRSLFFLAEDLLPHSFPTNIQDDSKMGDFPRAPFLAVSKDQHKDSFQLKSLLSLKAHTKTLCN